MKKKCLSLTCYVSRKVVDTERDRCIICGKPLVPEVDTVQELIDYLDQQFQANIRKQVFPNEENK